MSDELRIARENIDKLVAESTKEPNAYGARQTRVLMILSELCDAVENLEKQRFPVRPPIKP